MVAQLGEIQFQGFFSFSSLSIGEETRFAELPLTDGKAILQHQGDELKTKTFGLSLHRAFQDPQEAIDRLNAYRKEAAILNFVNGEGLYMGKFVIQSLETTITKMSPQGRIDLANVAVTLKEWHDPDAIQTEFFQLEKEAFALEKNSPSPLAVIKTSPQPIGTVSLKGVESNSSSLAGLGLLNSATINQAEKESLLDKASQQFKKAKNSAGEGINTMNNAQDLQAVAPGLIAAFQTIESNAGLIAEYCKNGDLNNAVSQSSAILASLAGLETAILPLNIKLIRRK